MLGSLVEEMVVDPPDATKMLGKQDLLVAVRIEPKFVGILPNHYYTVPFYGIIIHKDGMLLAGSMDDDIKQVLFDISKESDFSIEMMETDKATFTCFWTILQTCPCPA